MVLLIPLYVAHAIEEYMAKFYEVPIYWKDSSQTKGLAVGNNAACDCACGQVLLGPHEGLYPIDLALVASAHSKLPEGRNRDLWITSQEI